MGSACARKLAAGGARLVLFDKKEAHLEGALSIEGDVTVARDVETAVELALSRFGRLDVLVNAAGVLLPTRFLDMTEDEWDWVVAVNLKGAFLTSRAVAPAMKARGYGRIVHFSSTAGKTVSTLGGSHYTASKHGVLGLTRALAKELAPHGITVNAVCPGLIDTEMVRETVSPEAIARYEASFPISRLGTPDEVAELVSFLASDRAAYITGAALDINGGDFLA
jgi:3-oxoacyl-[acyl-carrier protein] reductase